MIIGSQILHKKVCETSSMNWAKEVFSHVNDGTVFLADEYRSARGRQGRVWHLYPGQLVMTFVLKPDLSSHQDLDSCLRYLTLAIAAGIKQALESYRVSLKWPNDFVIGGKKAGGMLAEAVWSDSCVIGLIVGYSINVNNLFCPDDPLYHSATSIKAELGKDVFLPELYKDLYAALDEWYDYWKAGEYEKIFSTWKGALSSLGKTTNVHYHDGSMEIGYAKDVTKDGDLVFVSQGGEEKVVPFCFVTTVSG